MTIDDYDRRKDDRLEAGLCQWCGHEHHGDRRCLVPLTSGGVRGMCLCGVHLVRPPAACEFCGHAAHDGRMCDADMPPAALHGGCTCGAPTPGKSSP